MTGMIQNRESFLDNIAGSLGRTRQTAKVERPKWKFNPQGEVLKNATQDHLVDVLKTQCLKIHTDLFTTDKNGLLKTLKEVVSSYGDGPIITWKDSRFSDWGLDPLFKEQWPNEKTEVYEWDSANGEENIRQAERANVGITISEMTLAESGTVVLFSDKDKGRSVSFLPTTYIAIVPKSTIVPRITQAAKKMREMHLQGKEVASCVNFITGPSNSADIELNLVVGVHGPVKAAYIVVDDL